MQRLLYCVLVSLFVFTSIQAQETPTDSKSTVHQEAGREEGIKAQKS